MTIKIILDSDNNEHVLIDHGNGHFTSILKSIYDEELERAKVILTP